MSVKPARYLKIAKHTAINPGGLLAQVFLSKVLKKDSENLKKRGKHLSESHPSSLLEKKELVVEKRFVTSLRYYQIKILDSSQ